MSEANREKDWKKGEERSDEWKVVSYIVAVNSLQPSANVASSSPSLLVQCSPTFTVKRPGEHADVTAFSPIALVSA